MTDPVFRSQAPRNVIDGIAVARHDAIAEVILSRPEVHNALNLAMWQRLGAVFRELGADPQLRVIVMRGAGGRAFSAGADIAEFRAVRVGVTAARRYNDDVAEALDAIASAPQPVIAMIGGLAVGGGCEIAALCDLRIASHDARLGIPINRLGVTLGIVESRALVNLIGPGHAKDLLLTGRLVDAEEALRMGLLSRVIPAERLEEETRALARRVAAGAPLAMTVNKLTINALARGLTDRDRAQIDEMTAAVYDGSDLREGISAFLEKRDPRFRGREE